MDYVNDYEDEDYEEDYDGEGYEDGEYAGEEESYDE